MIGGGFPSEVNSDNASFVLVEEIERECPVIWLCDDNERVMDGVAFQFSCGGLLMQRVSVKSVTMWKEFISLWCFYFIDFPTQRHELIVSTVQVRNGLVVWLVGCGHNKDECEL